MEFYSACEKGDLQSVIKLLDDNFDCGELNETGQTGLHIACEKGHIDIVKLLLENPLCDPNKDDRHGCTAFYRACVRILLEDSRIDTMKYSHTKSTPFHVACENNNIDIVKMLLDEPTIDLNALFRCNNTPLDTVCRWDHSDIFRLFLESDRIDFFKPEISGKNPFDTAYRYNSINIVKLLLDYNPFDSLIRNSNALWHACEKEYDDLALTLLKDDRIDPTKIPLNKGSVFYVACAKNLVPVVKMLIDDDRIDVMEKFHGLTPLHVASFNGCIGTIEILLKSDRIDPNNRNNLGETPFFRACDVCYASVIEMMLNCDRIDPLIPNNDGETPFYRVCDRISKNSDFGCNLNNVNCIKLILQKCEGVVIPDKIFSDRVEAILGKYR